MGPDAPTKPAVFLPGVGEPQSAVATHTAPPGAVIGPSPGAASCGDDPSVTLLWTPQPGSRASCQLGRRIGAGGFAEVFEAELLEPRQPPRRVALKRLLPSLRGDPLRQRQLRREAQIAASLHHPNIAQVLSLVELGDEVALAMELCEGLQVNHLLHRLAQRGLGLSLVAAAHITAGLFAALRYLEDPLGGRRPLVHADISLENLILTSRGEVKLIDFGIAAEELGAAAADPLADDALTSLHQAAGKRPYLPPEGMPRHGPSSQSDLYAAGVCFWELCTGCRFPVLPAFVRSREMGSLIAFAAEELPDPAWQLLMSCLAVDPRARMQRAEEGLLLCQALLQEDGGGRVAPALGALVESVSPAPGAAAPTLPSDESLLVLRQEDFLGSLVLRVHSAFCAYRTAAFTLCPGDDPSGLQEPPLPAALATGEHARAECFLWAVAGAPFAGDEPSRSLLFEALDTGFAQGPDGALLFRVRASTGTGAGQTVPAGPRSQVLYVCPGPGCVYDPLAQALLRNLLR
jgi:hypothetical protein